jgi:4,5-dihydroxyphthalate decarboxylase
MAERVQLTTAIGARSWRQGLEAVQGEARQFALSFVDVSPIHRAFAPMAREQKFDVSEMAIVTALQAIAYGKPLLPLPVAMAARFQQGCLIARRSRVPTRPADLAGRRIAVRAYSQTTGVWLRGILENDYGLAADAVRWITQEGAHVAEYRDPPWVERAPSGRSLADLLRNGDVDAAIFGNDLPDDPDFAPVIADPDAAAREWYAKHGVVPINHILVVRKDVAMAHADAIRELWTLVHVAKPQVRQDHDMAPIGIAAMRRALTEMLTYCEQQALLPRTMTVDEVFAESIEVLGDALND